VTNANDEAAARVRQFQLPPKIDTNQAGASEAYGEGSIQILKGWRWWQAPGHVHR
jgi:DNA gyrase subunit B